MDGLAPCVPGRLVAVEHWPRSWSLPDLVMTLTLTVISKIAELCRKLPFGVVHQIEELADPGRREGRLEIIFPPSGKQERINLSTVEAAELERVRGLLTDCFLKQQASMYSIMREIDTCRRRAWY